MQQLFVAGILYLTGIAVILVLKPEFMFMSDGSWKEFGIGRNPATHTVLPFWLFAVVWALLSYIIVTFVFIMLRVRTTPDTPPVNINTRKEYTFPPEEDIIPIKRRTTTRSRAPSDLSDGYYFLNSKATEEAGGIPKYIYLGKGLPPSD